MGSWINPDTYTWVPNIPQGALIEINGYKICKPNRFKNLAHERAFEIALVLAQKKPTYNYTQRMGDQIIQFTSPAILTTSECIDIIMFNGIKEIQLSIDAANPSKVAKDSMKLVPGFFDPDIVIFGKLEKCKKMRYLQISKKTE